MRRRIGIIITAAVCALAAAGAALAASTGSYQLADGSTLNISASTFDFLGTSKIVLRQNARVKMINSAARTMFDAQASKIVVSLAPASGKPGATATAIESVDMTGPVDMLYTAVDPKTGVRSTTTARSDSAFYDGSTQMATLTGSVKVTGDNPYAFTMQGDKATVNLKPEIGADELRFKVESSPGVSRIEVTPKSEARTQ